MSSLYKDALQLSFSEKFMYIDINYALRHSFTIPRENGKKTTLAEILPRRVSEVLPRNLRDPKEMRIIRSLAQGDDDLRHLYGLAGKSRKEIEDLYDIDGAQFLETGLQYYGMNFSTRFEEHFKKLIRRGFLTDEYYDYQSCVGYYARAVQDLWTEGEEDRKSKIAIVRLAGITGLPLPENINMNDPFVRMSFEYCQELLEAFKASR